MATEVFGVVHDVLESCPSNGREWLVTQYNLCSMPSSRISLQENSLGLVTKSSLNIKIERQLSGLVVKFSA